MIVRALNSSGDWLFGQGLSSYKSGIAALEQSLQTRVSMFIGDCFFSLNSGIDWFNLLGSKNELSLQLAISAVILNTQNVTSLLQLSINLNPMTRAFSIQYQVTSTLGVATGQLTTATINNFLLTESGYILTTESGVNIIV